MARVLRRSPPRSAGGTGLARASLISPRVTRSQWHTIWPYAGSAAIRSASLVRPQARLADIRHHRHRHRPAGARPQHKTGLAQLPNDVLGRFLARWKAP